METVNGSHKSLRRVFTLSILAVHLAVLALALGISFALLFSESKNQALDGGRKNLEYLQSQLDSFSTNLSDIRNLLMQDQNVKDFLATKRTDSLEDITIRINVSQRLSEIIQSYNCIDSITIFQWSGAVMGVSSLQVSQSGSSEDALPVQQTQTFKNITAVSPLTWGGCFLQNEIAPNIISKNGEKKVIAMLMPINDIWNPGHLSVVSLNVPLSYFDFLYSKNASAGSNVYLYDGKGNCLLNMSSGKWKNQAANNYGKRILAQEEGTDNFTGQNGTTRTKVVFLRDTKTGWYMAEEIPYPVFLRNMMQLQATTGLTYIISIILIAFVSYFILLKLFRSFRKMTDLMTDIGKGDLDKRLPAMEYQELDTLTSKFNLMMEQIQKLMVKNQTYEREKRELEIESLQAQINPHFLYNSLTTIRWMASMARASHVCQALLALSNVLQPVFAYPGIMWSISSELNFVQNFVDIMQFRFGGNINCIYNVSPELEKMPILRFLLQPAVENAITHGLCGKKDSTIKIDMEQVDGSLVIRISDNGCGIDPVELEHLNRSLADKSRPAIGKQDHGFGLYNINRRIRLHYGEEYGIALASVVNEGTTVTIRIPL